MIPLLGTGKSLSSFLIEEASGIMGPASSGVNEEMSHAFGFLIREKNALLRRKHNETLNSKRYVHRHQQARKSLARKFLTLKRLFEDSVLRLGNREPGVPGSFWRCAFASTFP